MRKLTFIFALILTASVFLAGCGSSSSETKKDDNKITIYTTVYPLQYFAEQIGGDYVDVNSVYPAGVDEHTFEPTQKDIINIAEADLFYYIGYNLEGFVTNAMDGVDYTYFYTCGPEPMLKAVYNASTTSGQMSFEERMGCGFGACMGCSCKTITGYKRICKEGPVMKKEEVLW